MKALREYVNEGLLAGQEDILNNGVSDVKSVTAFGKSYRWASGPRFVRKAGYVSKKLRTLTKDAFISDEVKRNLTKGFVEETIALFAIWLENTDLGEFYNVKITDWDIAKRFQIYLNALAENDNVFNKPGIAIKVWPPDSKSTGCKIYVTTGKDRTSFELIYEDR